MKSRRFRAFSGRYSRGGVEEVLGPPNPDWDWEETEATSEECGLTPGMTQTAGWGDGDGAARLWIHADGICVRPGLLTVVKDQAFAKKIATLLDKASRGEVR